MTEFRDYVWGLALNEGPADRDRSLPGFLIGIKQYFEECVLFV